MRILHKHVVTLVLLGAFAGIAWATAWYAHQHILALRDAKVAAIEAAQKDGRAHAAAALMRSAVAESAQARAQLEVVARTDVVSIASAIESTGKATGAKVRVADVSQMPDTDPQRANLTGVHSVGFSVEGTGTFQQLVGVMGLLENLPAPATIEQLALTRVQGGVATWRLTMRLRVLTAMNAS